MYLCIYGTVSEDSEDVRVQPQVMAAHHTSGLDNLQDNIEELVGKLFGFVCFNGLPIPNSRF